MVSSMDGLCCSLADLLTTPHHSSKLLVPGSLAAFPLQGCHYSRDFSIYGNDLIPSFRTFSPQFLDLLVIFNSLFFTLSQSSILTHTLWTITNPFYHSDHEFKHLNLQQQPSVHQACWCGCLQLLLHLH